jgi:hypothetical protein
LAACYRSSSGEDGKPNRQRLTRENSRVGHNPRTSTATTQLGIRRLHHPRVERNGSGEDSGIHDYSNVDKKIQIDDDTMMVIDTHNTVVITRFFEGTLDDSKVDKKIQIDE